MRNDEGRKNDPPSRSFGAAGEIQTIKSVDCALQPVEGSAFLRHSCFVILVIRHWPFTLRSTGLRIAQQQFL